MTVVVKVCGVTCEEDAAAMAAAGVDWIGLNFWPRSKRAVKRARAVEIARAARSARSRVVLCGVFVDQPVEEVEALAAELSLDRVQLHGDEPAEVCARFGARAIKAIALAGDGDVERVRVHPCRTILVDTPSAGYGGSGRTFDWSLARAAVATGKEILLAGGLTPENVAEAVRAAQPFGVDVASGVESAPGRKDPERVRQFIEAAKTSS